MVRVGCVVSVSVCVGVWREDDCVMCGEGGMCVVFCWKPSKGAPANVLSHVFRRSWGSGCYPQATTTLRQRRGISCNKWTTTV